MPRPIMTRILILSLATGFFFQSQMVYAVRQAPSIDRVEPPNWWTGMKWNQVQLLLTGKNLVDATFSCPQKQLVIEKITASKNGHYAFVNVRIPETLPADKYSISVQNAGGQVEFSFPILKRDTLLDRHAGFSNQDVIYLITPDRFANGNQENDRTDGLDDFDPTNNRKRHGGDLQGITERLDYLNELGITTIWLNPILENSGRSSYHGYATTDLYRVDPRFGTNQEYKNLVEEAHQRGLKVIFDHVNNHIGIKHPWNQDLPTEDWFNGSVASHYRQKHYLHSVSDPHAAANSAELLKTFWFVDGMPDVNQKNEFLANYLIQNTIWWIEFSGMDGIREDTYPYNDQAFMARWAKAILDEYPNFNIVGEIWSNHPAYIALFQDGSRMPLAIKTNLPCVMDFPLMMSWRKFLEGEGTLREVYETYSQDFVYADLQKLVVFLDNHDISRALFHAKDDAARVKLATAVLLFARGIPQILYGSEIGMLGGESHVELRADFPGGFPGPSQNAFTAEGRTKRQAEFFDYYQKLLRLRKSYPALSQGKMIHFAPTWSNDVYKILKIHKQQKILILANGTPKKTQPDLTELQPYLAGAVRLKNLMSEEELVWNEDSKLSVPPMAAAVYLVVE